MKTLLKRSTLLLGLMTCASAGLSLPAFSMGREKNNILELNCNNGYKVNISRQVNSGELFYSATGPSGNLKLGGGNKSQTEEADHFTFKNNIYRYEVVHGLNENRGMAGLTVYKNSRLIIDTGCKPGYFE